MVMAIKSKTFKKEKTKEMIKNFKDIVILLITTGVLVLLGVIIIGDYWGSIRRK
jgi:hypothetical protein